MRQVHNNDERGSVLVELAMVVLPLMLIVMGMVEVGGAWRDKSQAIQASRQGARVITTESIALTDEADREALLAVLAGVPQGSSGAADLQIRKVIIYNPAVGLAACDGVGESNPKDMTSLPGGPASTVPGCNVYMAGNNPGEAQGGNGYPSLDTAEILAHNWNGSSSAWDAQWNAGDKNNNIGTASPVGVYVEMYRPWITGFFPGDGTLVSGFTIMRIEPDGL